MDPGDIEKTAFGSKGAWVMGPRSTKKVDPKFFFFYPKMKFRRLKRKELEKSGLDEYRNLKFMVLCVKAAQSLILLK